MAYQLSIPARINLLGNPSDGNEGDYATISTAIDLYARAQIEFANHIQIEQRRQTPAGFETLAVEGFTPAEIPLPYTGRLDLLKAGINRLYAYSPEFRQKLGQAGFRFAAWTEVPRQSGLGGSSLFILLILGALRSLYQLDPAQHNNYILAELTQRVEALELGITCGYADRYVPIMGGIAYLDYRGKLHQQPLGHEPFATYERLTPWVSELPLLVATSGVQHQSGDVHGQMRPRYLDEFNAWQNTGGAAPPMVAWMQSAWEIAWRGKMALLQNDWPTFGQLMDLNHRIVDEMMAYCGFTDGAGWANNLLVETARRNGALGAKLTGAGAGGSVFALVLPDQIAELRQAWRLALDTAGLQQADIFQPRIAPHGLRIEEA